MGANWPSSSKLTGVIAPFKKNIHLLKIVNFWLRAIFGASNIFYYSYFKKFKTADDMNNHMIEKHKIEALRFNCENCSKVGSE